ncbi:MAG: glycosyltransferase family 9 protein, partial [Deltaproteobacteria bacterium]|nr:glycosyltransferase family 9 protein [Deltaproteobacteria bacterium]
RASGAKFRIGYRNYRFPHFYTHTYAAAAAFWGREKTHSAEQQVALLGLAGIPVKTCPKSKLPVDVGASARVDERLRSVFTGPRIPGFALIHPSAADDTKIWAAAGFAATIDHLLSKGIPSVLVSTEAEIRLISEIESACGRQLPSLSDLSLPEVVALASKASLFVGNDSGIAHISAAVNVPTVVIFGSSNITHWSPWTDAPHRVVFNRFDCQPCPGHHCRVFDEPKCILSVEPEQVIGAVNALIMKRGSP